ncbi:AraC family transcriptional regulator [Actinopolyspora xinjiangensis]|uniref:AraC family transcriptional regulator n=1 Tax=Actinopolyspora xinjiangensis TaxID=405564 RepID=A0A1H0QSP1_9ACTN|nr:AraC family transcriptional regulator [Actinopolyspora xinjiangensis]SDP20383.1 AraC family transcriptional regulator [Actinopolyspora xinjiangensis]
MLDRLNEAMDHIERHVAADIDVEELARIARTSPYHFRRMFSTLAGIPLSEYVRRRRLTLAAAEVLAERRSLLDIAVTYGYGSGEAFARAFRAVHGVGPAEARRSGAVLTSQPRMTFHLTVEGSTPMEYRIVEKPEFRLLGYRTEVPIVHEGHNEAIAEFTASVGTERLARLKPLSDQEPGGIVSVVEPLDDSSRAEGSPVDFLRGVVSSAALPPELAEQGVAERSVPAGTWAVFRAEGEPPETAQHIWRDVYTQWFPSNPYRSVPGPEILSAQPSGEDSRMSYELWLPVVPTG